MLILYFIYVNMYFVNCLNRVKLIFFCGKNKTEEILI